MRRLRWAELVSGMCAAAVGAVAIALGIALPVSSSDARVYQDGVLVAHTSHATSLADFVGLRAAIAAIAIFAVLCAWILLAAVLHSRERVPRWLGLEWSGAVLLALASWLGVWLFGYLFFPAAILGVVCALLGTVRQRREGSPVGMNH